MGVQTYLEYFISNLESSVLVSAALWVHAADEDAHLRPVTVAGEADAQARQALVQVHQQRAPIYVVVLAFYFFCLNKKFWSVMI